MSLADSFGLEVSTDDPEVVAGIDTFVESMLSYGTKAGAIFPAAARPDAGVMAPTLAAVLELFMQTGESASRARPHLANAALHLDKATPREKLWHRAVSAWAQDDTPAAIAAWEAILSDHPRDLAAMKMAQVQSFHIGDLPRMLALAETVRGANAENPRYLGMRAFALEEMNRLDEAEAEARRAVELLRAEPWSHHAVAHVMEAQGRAEEGYAWMRSLSDSWASCNSFMLTHNWWHTALFALDCDRPGEALELYDKRIWGVWKEYSQDQANAVSMLARLEFVGLDVGIRWQDVAVYLSPRLHEHVDPFLDLHYLLGLVRAGREASAGEMLLSLADHARRQTRPDAVAGWRDAALPIARGILAYGREEWTEAMRQIGQGLPHLGAIGGSHAQRDLFHWLWLEAGRRAEAWSIVRPHLEERAAARPGVARHRRELAAAC